MRSTHALPAALAALALGLAGCGGGTTEDTPTGEAANPGASERPMKEQAGTKITMKQIQFKPERVTVKVGDTVTWVNEEQIEHNAVATEGADFRSELFGEGKTFEWKAEKAGMVKYVCTVHPGMDGTITVE